MVFCSIGLKTPVALHRKMAPIGSLWALNGALKALITVKVALNLVICNIDTKIFGVKIADKSTEH